MAEGDGGEKIKVGDKEYSPNELAERLNERESFAQKLESMKPLETMLTQHNISAEQLANETRGAFEALVRMQEAGMIDADGNIVQKKAEAQQQTPAMKQDSGQQKPGLGTPSVDDIATKALERVSPEVTALKSEVNELRNSLNLLYREKISDTVKAKGINVQDEDIHLAMAEANKTGKDFWSILDQRAKRYTDLKQQTIASFAKEHNLDLDQLNALREMQSKEGNVAAAIVEGKTISNRPGAKKAGAVSALEATKELLRRTSMQ